MTGTAMAGARDRAVSEGTLHDLTEMAGPTGARMSVFVTGALLRETMQPNEDEIAEGNTAERRLAHTLFNWSVGRTGEAVSTFPVTHTFYSEGRAGIKRVVVKSVEGVGTLTLSMASER